MWVGEIACLRYIPFSSYLTSYDCGETSRARSLASLRSLGRKSMPSSIREKSNPVQWDSVSPLRKFYPVVSSRLDIPSIPFRHLKVVHERRKKK